MVRLHDPDLDSVYRRSRSFRRDIFSLEENRRGGCIANKTQHWREYLENAAIAIQRIAQDSRDFAAPGSHVRCSTVFKMQQDFFRDPEKIRGLIPQNKTGNSWYA